MDMDTLKTHSHIDALDEHSSILSHACPIYAAVCHVSEHREMSIGAVLEDARSKTERNGEMYLFV